MFSLSSPSPATASASASANAKSTARPPPPSLSLHSSLSFFLHRHPHRHRHRHRRRRRIPLSIRSIDAAQPYDYETKLSIFRHRITNSYPKLKIAVIGFGNFGQFLAKTLAKQGHKVLAYSRTDYCKVADNMGVSFFSDPHDLCEEHPEVILLCTSIISTEPVLRALPLQRLKRSTLFVDVLSVKEFPRSLFLQVLPCDFDILCTHPMFGPESGKNGWSGLPFVYDKVRIGKDESRVKRCENFLDVFRREGCRMVEMSCAEHDRFAAGTQFITHMVGRVLGKLELEDTPINTKGYESLLNLVDNTSKDSFELFYGLFLYNKNAMEQLERMDVAFEMVKQQLFGHLHGLLRKQLFGGTEMDVDDSDAKKDTKLLSGSSQNGSVSSPESVKLESEESDDSDSDKETKLLSDSSQNGSVMSPEGSMLERN